MVAENRYWTIADQVKRRLYSRLRMATAQVDYLNYEEYQRKFREIPSILVNEWEEIQREYAYGANSEIFRLNEHRLKGNLYEVLFYYACLKTQALFIDAEICEMEGVHFEESPPWFEATPIYDIIPTLHHIHEKGIQVRKAPQVKADFLISYVDDRGPTPFAFVDVKSRSPSEYSDAWNWQVTAAMRHGFIFQLAYPRTKSKYPISLEDWEIKTPCLNCKDLSDEFRKCTKCGKEIFPFTVVDARYEAESLWELLGKTRKRRF